MVDWIGKQLGNYAITGLIGRGGMSSVYRAQQTTVQREVAIKVLDRVDDLDPSFVARFEREVKIIASLEHIHILPIYDYGEVEGYSYLVMRYIDGGSLNARIKQGPIPLPDVERYITQIAAALDYAHQRGVVHRDLKPHNILLDKQGNAYLSDFGIAKLVSGEQSLTQTGVAIGTPGYMAPEQWQGSHVDARTDIYALGAMLFELLTGHVPFSSENVISLMYKQLNEQPPLMITMRPDLPPALDPIVQQAMAKSADERIASAGELARRVSAALRASEPASYAPPTPDLPPPGYGSDESPTYIVKTPPKVFSGRMWVLDAFERWRRLERTPVFFLTGPDGIGKSELARRFAGTLGERVISYELSATQARSLEPHFFVDTVAEQLHNLLPEGEHAQPRGDTLLSAFADPVEAFENRVLLPLQDAEEPVYLLIDGLVIAFDYPGTTIVDVVAAALDDLPEALRLIVTATPNERLDSLFRHAERLELQATPQEDRADMLATLSTRFATLVPNLSKGEVDLRALEKKSEGNPLYLNTVFEHLAYKRLELSDLDSLPPGLDALYGFLVERAEQTDPQVKPLLMALTLARAPLSTELLADILDEPETRVRSRLSKLRPLVHQDDDTWELVHPALRYWLISAHDAELVEVQRRIAGTLSRSPFEQMNPYTLEHLTAHWVAGQQPDQAYALLADLNFVAAKLNHMGLNETVADFNFVRSALSPAGGDPIRILDTMVAAIHDLAGALAADPSQAFGLLYNRLSGAEGFEELLLASAAKRRTPWLRLEWPRHRPGSPDSRVVWNGSPVVALAASANTVRWLVACQDGRLLVWDGQILIHEWDAYRLIQGMGIPSACALNADGTLALTGFEDGAACIWNPDTGNVVSMLPDHDRGVTACAFSAQTRRALTASEDRLLRLWDVRNGKLIQSFTAHPAAVQSCAFSSDGDKLLAVSGDADGTIRVWDIQANQLVRTLTAQHGAVTACVTLHDGIRPLAVSGSAHGLIAIWDLHTGTQISALVGHAARITSLSVDANANTPYGEPIVASASEDHAVRLWGVRSGRALAKIENHRRVVTGCAMTADQHVLSGSLDGTLRLSPIQPEPVIEAHGGEVTCCAFTPDSPQLLTGSLDRELRLWDAHTGRVQRVFKGHVGGINGCAVRADGQIALSASTDGTLRVWDIQRGTLRHLLRDHSGTVLACALSPQPVKLVDGEPARWLAVSGGADRVLRIWDTHSGQMVSTLKGHGDAVTACTFSPTGEQVVSVSRDRTARLWKLADPDAVQVVARDNGTFTACAFSPDGTTLALGLEDGRIQVISLESGSIAQQLDPIDPVHERVSGCGFSANGQLFYAAFADKMIHVWNRRDYPLIASFYAEDSLTCAAMASDNLTFAAGDSNGRVYLLKLEGSTRRKTRT